MSFFLLYLLIHGPIMAASLGGFSGGALVILTILSVLYFIGLAIASDMSHYVSSVSEMAEQPTHKSLIKWIKRLFVTFLVIFCISKAVPDQRAMAIIVGGGVTYEAITSDAGKRIGGKVAGALEKKIDEILSKPEEAEEAPAKPAKGVGV